MLNQTQWKKRSFFFFRIKKSKISFLENHLTKKFLRSNSDSAYQDLGVREKPAQSGRFPPGEEFYKLDFNQRPWIQEQE